MTKPESVKAVETKAWAVVENGEIRLRRIYPTKKRRKCASRIAITTIGSSPASSPSALCRRWPKMIKTTIRVYRQDRPASWLKENTDQTWRCDIYPSDGSDHHGLGATEAEALVRASHQYRNWEFSKATSQVVPEVE